MRACSIENGLARIGQFGAGHLVAQGRANDHRPRAAFAKLDDDLRNVVGARADDRQVWNLVAFLDANAGSEAETRPRHRRKIEHRASEASALQVVANHLGVAAGLACLLDHGHGTRPEEVFEVADCHGSAGV